VGESEFMSLARRAGRWVLAGEPAVESRSRSKANAKSGFFARLWPMLHCDHWYSADGRVICQLRVLSAADRSRLETEPLADHPEVELHILMPDGGEPALAEVIFAPGLPIEQAKLLLYRELNELPIPSGSGVWEERPQRLVYRLASCPAPQTVELEPGLRELYRPAGRCWQTVGFEFEAGTWPRERAESWTKRHLQARDTDRTTRLIVPHRMRPALANFVSALCFECAYAHRQPPALPTSAVVEFYPVPALVNEGGPRRRGDHGDNGLPRRLPPLRGGAGQELDLADFRHRERLPTELRSRLPEAGYVNLPEAHAVVRLLESRVSGGWSSPLTVLSLHAAQAEVIRHFAKLSPILAKSTVSIQIEAAAAFGQRECETAIVSLTRSHGHRAVTYGDEPGLLPLALTRARQRLILIGDAGTLARRAAWDGPLDHYDAPTAAAETAWAANLIAQLRSQTLPVSIHLHEGPP